jgi:hypothetical protein
MTRQQTDQCRRKPPSADQHLADEFLLFGAAWNRTARFRAGFNRRHRSAAVTLPHSDREIGKAGVSVVDEQVFRPCRIP